MKKAILCTVAALLLAPAAHAQTEAELRQAALDKAKLDLEFAKLALEQSKLQKDVLDSQIKALGLSGGDGKTTLAAEAGKIEGVMLASRALDSAAASIAGIVKKKVANGNKVALLAAGDSIDLSAAVALLREMRALNLTSAALVQKYCPAPTPPVHPFSIPLPVIGAALSLLKTDTEISGFSMASADAALIDAIAGKDLGTNGAWLFPKEMSGADDKNEIVTGFDAVLDSREAVMKCRDQISANAMTEALKKEAAPKLAELDAVATRTAAFVARISAPREGKPNELAAAIMASRFSADKGLLALRVTVNQAGGSLLKRSNLFTMLGAPAVGITGGLVVSWRLFDPADGTVKAAGVLVCRTALTNLNAIHKGRAGAPSCDWERSNPPANPERPGAVAGGAQHR